MLGQSFGGYGLSHPGGSRRHSARPNEGGGGGGPVDFMSKVRKRRESSAEIVVLYNTKDGRAREVEAAAE